jgi:hypothetical protein
MNDAQTNTEDLAAAFFEDERARGLSVADALRSATVAHPESATFLADYAYSVAAVDVLPDSPDDTRLAEMIAARSAKILGERFAATAKFPGILASAKAKGLDLLSLSKSLGMARSVLVKLDRRLIAAATVPTLALERIASALGCTAAALAAYLAGPPTLAASANYRASEAPDITALPREAFADAIATAVGAREMTADDAKQWAE